MEGEEYAIIVAKNKRIFDFELINGAIKKMDEVYLSNVESEYTQVNITLNMLMDK